jgi:hypothetical protein
MIVAVPIFLFSYQIVAALTYLSISIRDASSRSKDNVGLIFPWNIGKRTKYADARAAPHGHEHLHNGAVPKILLAAVTAVRALLLRRRYRRGASGGL